MKLWVKRLRAVWFLSDKRKNTPKPKTSFRPQLEELESREAPVALFNPLFASAFDQLDDPAPPSYTVVSGYDPLPGFPAGQSGDGGTSGGTSSGDGGSDGGATPPPSDNFSAGDPAAALSTMDLDANLFASVLDGDNAAFAAKIADDVGGPGGGAGGGGSGAAVVIGLPTPSAGTGQMGTQSGDTTPPPVTPGPPPALSAAPGTAETVGVGFSSSDFGLNPFTLRSGATISALTPFVVTPGMSVPAAQSGGQTVTTAGTAPSADGSGSSSGWSYDQTTTTAYALNASESTLPDGGLSYTALLLKFVSKRNLTK